MSIDKDKAKKRLEEFKEEQIEQAPLADSVEPVVDNPVTIYNDELDILKKQIEELKNELRFQRPTQNVAQVSGTKLVGRTDRFIVDKNYYPSPIERLSNEPKLDRFAFKLNYELNFGVSSVSYQTVDGLNMREPRFTLDLNKIILNEDTGEPTNERYNIATLIMHEDPDAAITIATDNGLVIDEDNEKDFLDEMRYIRMRDWLLRLFYPVPVKDVKKVRSEVIGNRLVQIFEANGESAQNIDVESLKKGRL